MLTNKTITTPSNTTMRRREPFTLTKWYLDCVAADGRTVIAYWASLAWHNVTLTWQNVTLYVAGQAPFSRSSLASTSPPEMAGDAITWSAPALACVVGVESRARPIAERLFESDAGIVEWHALAPAALVSFKLRGRETVQGPGYAERISISIPPWRLPIRELRWGRWIDSAASRSVVWIEWRGDLPRTWVFVDGVQAGAGVVTDESICADGIKILLGERRTLHARAFAELAAAIPPLHAIVPKSLLALRETKWCSAGTLLEKYAGVLTGCAIHEVAVFQ